MSWASTSKSGHFMFEFTSFAVLLASLIKQEGVGCKLQLKGSGEKNHPPRFWDGQWKDVRSPTGGIPRLWDVLCVLHPEGRSKGKGLSPSHPQQVLLTVPGLLKWLSICFSFFVIENLFNCTWKIIQDSLAWNSGIMHFKMQNLLNTSMLWLRFFKEVFCLWLGTCTFILLLCQSPMGTFAQLWLLSHKHTFIVHA